MKKIYFFILLLASGLIYSKPIEDFIQKDLHIQQFMLKKNSTKDLVEGGKVADVFFITSQAEDQTFIIKRFSKKDYGFKEFTKEKKAYEYLEKKNKKNFTTPKLISSYEDDEYSYLILSKAPGITLNQLLQKRQQIPFWDRKKYDQKILDSMKKTAEVFFEFHHLAGEAHYKKISSKSEFPTQLAKRVSTQLKNPRIESNFNNIKNKVKSKPLRFGLSHGDLHLGNIFFDDHGSQVTLIDFSTLSGHDEYLNLTPIADELGYFIAYFESIAYLHGISSKDTALFIDAFKSNYPHFKEMEEEVNYFRQIALLRLIEVCEDGSKDGYIDYQMRSIGTYCKRAIFFPLTS
jgi:fructosamine-3-kinase